MIVLTLKYLNHKKTFQKNLRPTNHLCDADFELSKPVFYSQILEKNITKKSNW